MEREISVRVWEDPCFWWSGTGNPNPFLTSSLYNHPSRLQQEAMLHLWLSPKGSSELCHSLGSHTHRSVHLEVDSSSCSAERLSGRHQLLTTCPVMVTEVHNSAGQRCCLQSALWDEHFPSAWAAQSEQPVAASCWWAVSAAMAIGFETSAVNSVAGKAGQDRGEADQLAKTLSHFMLYSSVLASCVCVHISTGERED